MSFLDPLAADAEANGLHLDDATTTMPKQVSPVLWSNRLSPLYRCFRVYVNGEHMGVIGQETPSAPWQATRRDSPFGETFATRALALAFVAPDATAQARVKRPAKLPQEGTVTATPKTTYDVGTVLKTMYKANPYFIEVQADTTFTLTGPGEGGPQIAASLTTITKADKALSGSARGNKFWEVYAVAREADEMAAAEAALPKLKAKLTEEAVQALVADQAAEKAAKVEAEYQERKATAEATVAAVDAEAEAGRKARNAAKNAARKARNAAKKAQTEEAA